jgi:uncharacterized protein (DUF427 family)
MQREFRLSAALCASVAESALTVVNLLNYHRLKQGDIRMPKAICNGQIIADSPHCEIIENNLYFPPEAIRREFFQPSDKHTVCGWKGTASYYNVVVDGEVNKDAAWYYPEPKTAAKNIEGYVAFWRGITVEK